VTDARPDHDEVAPTGIAHMAVVRTIVECLAPVDGRAGHPLRIAPRSSARA
jgi:hypothetical protein